MKPGYKQTEVGVIPEDWEVKRLSELLQASRNIRYGIVQPGKFFASGCYMLRSQDYSKGWAGPDGMHRVCMQLESQYRNARIRHNDLVITVVGAGIGQVVIVPDWLDGAILSRSTARVPVDEDNAARNFVRAFLEGPLGNRQILDCQKEGAQPVVSCLDLAKFSVAYPPLPEQRAIAGALSDVDALLGAQEALLAKKRDLKAAAMQQLLTGETRLPGFTGEWEVKTLGEVAILKNGYAFKSETYTPIGEYKVITIANVQDGVMTTDGCNLIQAEPGDLQPHQRLSIGDILISMTGNVGRICKVSEAACLLNQRVGKLIPMTIDRDFLFIALRQSKFISAMIGTAKGGAQPNLSSSDIVNYSFNIAVDPAEQIAIAAVLSDMDAEIAALEAQRDKTRALKQGMMQELLTGRIRLI